MNLLQGTLSGRDCLDRASLCACVCRTAEEWVNPLWAAYNVARLARRLPVAPTGPGLGVTVH